MNRREYRAQMDAVPFSPDFQDRTMARLEELAQKKEKNGMKKWNLRTGLVAAAVAAALTVTAGAAVMMLQPQDVAQQAGNEALAAAFESGEAVMSNETKTVGDYSVTLMGLISGEGLSRVENLPGGVTQDKTYAVLAYARTDGTAIEEDVPDLTVSPLVEGYAPWQLNAWTLGGGTHTFAQEGTLYYLFECDNVEVFADHTVYLAVYPGTHTPPSAELFDFEEKTGAITPKGDTALFTLPLDPSKADPQKAQALADWDRPQPAESQEPTEDLGDEAESKSVSILEDPDHPGEYQIIEN
ncbi:MAG: hypothetical protein HFF05_04440 [Oscillospiraceae bacterium]|nr:hypothetical protein [Oscillospiraceae bacterium]